MDNIVKQQLKLITEKEKEYGVDFAQSSLLSKDLLFANENNVTIYGGDNIGYTRVEISEEMPLHVKKVFLAFQKHFYERKEYYINCLKETYHNFPILNKNEKDNSLLFETRVSLTLSDMCELLDRRDTDNNKKDCSKIFKEFSNYMLSKMSYICFTDRTLAMQPAILTKVHHKRGEKYYDFYFSDFYLIQLMTENFPMIIPPNINKTKSNTTFSLALFLTALKYSNIKHVKNGTNKILSVRALMKICNINASNYDKKMLMQIIKKTLNKALESISDDCTWKYSKEKINSKTDLIYDTDIILDIPIFNDRVELLKLEKSKEKIENDN